MTASPARTEQPANEAGSLRARAARWLPPAGPARVIVIVSLVSSIGLGLYMSGSAVYFVRAVGLTPTQVGLGLSLAGVGGLLAGVPIGHLADRLGPRATAMALVAAQAVLLVCATQVTAFWQFLVVIIGLGLVEAGADVARQAILAGVINPENRVAVSAFSRAVFNGGFSVGVFAAGLAIAVDTRAAYAALMLGNAASALVVCLLYLKLPRLPGNRNSPESHGISVAVRDRPYMTMAFVSGLLQLSDIILTVGIPLWVLQHTEAPRPVAAWLIGINTFMVVTLQVRAARGAKTLRGATRLHGWAFLSVAAMCLVASLTASVPRWPAVALLVLAAALLTMGELWGESARWTIRYDLALPSAQGQYGGAFQLGTALPKVLGPLAVTALTDRAGPLGWLVLAGVFLVGFAFVGRAIQWAARTRTT